MEAETRKEHKLTLFVYHVLTSINLFLLLPSFSGNYKKFNGLKAYNDKLVTLIAIGGWNEGSKRLQQPP